MKKIKKLSKLFLLIILTFTFSMILTGCRNDNINDVRQLTGKKIGIVEGTIYEDLVGKIINNPKVQRYNNPSECIEALLKGEIDAFIHDEVVCTYYIESNKYINYLNLSEYKYDAAYIMPKEKKYEKLRDELNEYIYEMKMNNELVTLQTKWTSDDQNVKVARDIDSLEGPNGTIHILAPQANAPMVYIDKNKMLGYDVDVLYLFAKKYGYKLDIDIVTFDEMFKGILEGKADLGIGNIFINEDRKEKYILTDPVFSNYVSVGVLYDSTKTNGKKSYNKLSDLKYKTIGVLEGTIYDNVAIEHIAGCKLKYFSAQDELYKALDDNNVDGVIYDEPLARYKLNKETSFKMIDRLITYDEYGVIFNKDSEFANKLRNEYNTFLNDIRNSGEYDEINLIWFGNDDSKKYVPYDELPNVNGRVRMCVTAEIGEPFAYIKDDRFVGYDVDMMYRFCKKYGYALQIKNVSFTKIFDEVINNNYDLSACCISITEERKKLINYSNPNYLGGLVCIVKN